MTRIDNIRVVRAPRGPELSAKSWLTEAPMRMLMNNLDPDVAESPDELIVYGGIGRAARDWETFERIVATLKRSKTTKRCWSSQASLSAFFAPMRDAPRVLHRQFEPRAALGHVGAFPRARSQGPDDVRPDDGRLVDLHRYPRHRAGHV